MYGLLGRREEREESDDDDALRRRRARRQHENAVLAYYRRRALGYGDEDEDDEREREEEESDDELRRQQQDAARAASRRRSAPLGYGATLTTSEEEEEESQRRDDAFVFLGTSSSSSSSFGYGATTGSTAAAATTTEEESERRRRRQLVAAAAAAATASAAGSFFAGTKTTTNNGGNNNAAVASTKYRREEEEEEEEGGGTTKVNVATFLASMACAVGAFQAFALAAVFLGAETARTATASLLEFFAVTTTTTTNDSNKRQQQDAAAVQAGALPGVEVDALVAFQRRNASRRSSTTMATNGNNNSTTAAAATTTTRAKYRRPREEGGLGNGGNENKKNEEDAAAVRKKRVGASREGGRGGATVLATTTTRNSSESTTTPRTFLRSNSAAPKEGGGRDNAKIGGARCGRNFPAVDIPYRNNLPVAYDRRLPRSRDGSNDGEDSRKRRAVIFGETTREETAAKKRRPTGGDGAGASSNGDTGATTTTTEATAPVRAPGYEALAAVAGKVAAEAVLASAEAHTGDDDRKRRAVVTEAFVQAYLEEAEDDPDKLAELESAAKVLRHHLGQEKEDLGTMMGGVLVPSGILVQIASYCMTRTCQNNFASTCTAMHAAVFTNPACRKSILWPTNVPRGPTLDTEQIGEVVLRRHNGSGPPEPIQDVVLSRDGSRAAFQLRRRWSRLLFEHKIQVWDRIGGLVKVIYGSWMSDLTMLFSADNSLLLLHGNHFDGGEGCSLHVWDLSKPDDMRPQLEVQPLDYSSLRPLGGGLYAYSDERSGAIGTFWIVKDNSGRISYVPGELLYSNDDRSEHVRHVATFFTDPGRNLVASCFSRRNGDWYMMLYSYNQSTGGWRTTIEMPLNCRGCRCEFSNDGQRLFICQSSGLRVCDTRIPPDPNERIQQPRLVLPHAFFFSDLRVSPYNSCIAVFSEHHYPEEDDNTARDIEVFDVDSGTFLYRTENGWDNAAWKLFVSRSNNEIANIARQP